METALLFAGGSFIGRRLCSALRHRGWRVAVTARPGSAADGAVPCDLVDAGRVAEVVARERPARVVQCAGATRTDDFREMFELHVGGTLNVLDAVRRHAPGAAVLLLGSAAEYGPAGADELPVAEGHVAPPRSFFGASKVAQTQAARAAAAAWGLRVLAARPFNVIGPGLPGHYFAAALAVRLRRMTAEGPPRPFPVVNAHATRDFIDVRDVAEALAGLLDGAVPPPGGFEVYNVATGVETSLLEAAAELGRLAGGFTPVPAGAAASRAAASRSCGDAGRLRRAIGWRLRYSWRESLADLWLSEEVGAAARPQPAGDPGG
jgi:GDP-4-dehydro-6-deoxy-D-mannose reductase